MSKHISYNQWINNVILHSRDVECTVSEPCPMCEHAYDPQNCECGGAGIIVYDERQQPLG